jgi:acyl-CoA reductase-like NAD-dependent aldehyde dehydrogenase
MWAEPWARCRRSLSSPVLMELGGKGPTVVLRDADLKRAAKLCALGAFLHHGPICMSTDRIIVEREVADDFSKYRVEEVNGGYSEGVGFFSLSVNRKSMHRCGLTRLRSKA